MEPRVLVNVGLLRLLARTPCRVSKAISGEIKLWKTHTQKIHITQLFNPL